MLAPRHASRTKALKAVRHEFEGKQRSWWISSLFFRSNHRCRELALRSRRRFSLQLAISLRSGLPVACGRTPVLIPVTCRSGTSIRGEFPSQARNKRLKNALVHSAWVASCHDRLSRAYYDRNRIEGKQYHAEVMCLARRRLNVVFALVNHRTYYEEKTSVAI